jgi:hypothetical protein
VTKEVTVWIVCEVVVRVCHLVENGIAVPAELSLAKSTDHFVTAVFFLDLERALSVRTGFGALAHEEQIFALVNYLVVRIFYFFLCLLSGLFLLTRQLKLLLLKCKRVLAAFKWMPLLSALGAEPKLTGRTCSPIHLLGDIRGRPTVFYWAPAQIVHFINSLPDRKLFELNDSGLVNSHKP